MLRLTLEFDKLFRHASAYASLFVIDPTFRTQNVSVSDIFYPVKTKV
jgi:hypothetical protein